MIPVDSAPDTALSTFRAARLQGVPYEELDVARDNPRPARFRLCESPARGGSPCPSLGVRGSHLLNQGRGPELTSVLASTPRGQWVVGARARALHGRRNPRREATAGSSASLVPRAPDSAPRRRCRSRARD